MIERHLVLNEADPAIFYGVNNANLRMIKALCPKLRIMARDNVIKVMGDEEEIARFEETFQALEGHVVRYNLLSEEDILGIFRGKTQTLDATNSGTGDLGVDGKVKGTAVVHNSGTGDVTLIGTFATLKVNNSGTGDVSVSRATVEKKEYHNSGTGDIR